MCFPWIESPRRYSVRARKRSSQATLLTSRDSFHSPEKLCKTALREKRIGTQGAIMTLVLLLEDISRYHVALQSALDRLNSPPELWNRLP